MAYLFTAPKFQAFAATGSPLAGGKVYTYEAGTTTPKATYTTQAGSVENANPVILDANGCADIWLGDGAYKFVVTDAADAAAPFGTVDNISPGQDGAVVTSNLADPAQGASMVAYQPAGTGAQATTVHAKQRQRISVFDFMTSAQQADVRAGTLLVNVTTQVQAALDHAKSAAYREMMIEFPAGAYAVDELDFTGLSRVVIDCQGFVQITGMHAATDYIVKVDSIEAATTSSLVVRGNLSIQPNAGTNYKSGLYARWMTDSTWHANINGAFSVAAVDMDVCFNNDFQYLWAINNTTNKPAILCGTNNVNANRWRIRTSGNGTASGQTGLELTGSVHDVFGDCSALQTGVRLTAVRGARLTIYSEVCGKALEISGVNRGITIVGGLIEVASNGVGLDFSGGTVQGLNLIGVRFKGVSGGSNRTAMAFGSAAYYVNLVGCDFEGIDTMYTGTLRGNTGGVAEQLIGSTRHLTSGVMTMMGGFAQGYADTTISASGTHTPNADVANHHYLYITTTGAVTIDVPTFTPGANDGRPRVTLRIVNASGGTLNVSFVSGYRLAGAFTAPATGFNRAITFWKEGASWYEESRSAADIAN